MGVAAIGLVGVIVGRVRGGAQPGEVRVVHGGLPHIYIAYADDPLPVGTQVLVVNDRGARSVDVEEWDMPGPNVGSAGQSGGP